MPMRLGMTCRMPSSSGMKTESSHRCWWNFSSYEDTP